MKHYPSAGGKRLRPVLAMLAVEALGGDPVKAVPFGVCLELIHTFTLVHDDLMDHDGTRRGLITVHRKFDDYTAINAGDALFARAFEVLADTEVGGESLSGLVRDVACTVRLIGTGQQLDKDFEKSLDITEQDYMRMIEYKTAVLFRMAARGGAVVAGASQQQVEDMSEYGRLIGIGFQIWDDYLDLKASQEDLGKPVGSDIRNGKRTLMAVHGLERMDGGQKERFLKAFGNLDASEDAVADAIGVLEKTGSIDHARDMALGFCEKAKRLLEPLPDTESKKLLFEIADYMVKRDR